MRNRINGAVIGGIIMGVFALAFFILGFVGCVGCAS